MCAPTHKTSTRQQQTSPILPSAESTPIIPVEPAVSGTSEPGAPQDAVTIDAVSADAQLQDVIGESQPVISSSGRSLDSYTRALGTQTTVMPVTDVSVPEEQPTYDAEYWKSVQTDIVARYGTLTIDPVSTVFKMPLAKINPYAVAAFKGEGDYLPSHLYDVVGGMGLTMARVHDHGDSGEKDPTQPDLLFYAPRDPSKPSNAFGQGNFTDVVPDGDYVLIGWGYYADYAPGEVPQMPGVPDDAWFIHERGYHLLNGGFEMVAPGEESYRGEVSGAAPDPRVDRPHSPIIGAHGRVWDLHFWRTDLTTGTDSAPVLGIEAPQELQVLLPAETLDLSAGFFYPESPASPDAPAPEVTNGRVVVVN